MGSDSLVEIKSPYVAAGYTAQDAINRFPDIRKIFDKKDISKINKKHRYYYQIQGQLHITGRKHCLLVIHTTLSGAYSPIDYDHEFWNKKMEKQLVSFYNDCMLPEILDS